MTPVKNFIILYLLLVFPLGANPRLFTIENAKGVYAVQVEKFSPEGEAREEGGTRLRDFSLELRVVRVFTGSAAKNSLLRIQGTQAARRGKIAHGYAVPEGASAWSVRGSGRLEFYDYKAGSKFIVISTLDDGPAGISSPTGKIFESSDALELDLHFILQGRGESPPTNRQPGTSLRVEAAYRKFRNAPEETKEDAKAAYEAAVSACESGYLWEAAEIVSSEVMLEQKDQKLGDRNLRIAASAGAEALSFIIGECANRLPIKELESPKMERIVIRHRGRSELLPQRILARVPSEKSERRKLVNSWLGD